MAKLEFEITFDVRLLNKVIRQTQGDLFAAIFENDSELQEIINLYGIEPKDSEE